MKRIFQIILATALVLSFSLSAMADTRIHYTYTDTETGIVYHYGSFDVGDTDAGVKIGSRKYSLKSGIYMGESKNAFEEAKSKNNQFVIGLKADANTTDEYSVIPYSVDAEGNERNGHSITVNKNAYTKNVVDKTIDGVVVSDVRNGLDYNDGVGDGTDVNHLTIKADSAYLTTSSQNFVSLIKIDLTKLKKDAYANSNYHFTINAKTGTWGNATVPSVKLAAVGVAGLDWSEDEIPELSTSYFNYYVNNRVALDMVEIPINDTTKLNYLPYTLNLTGYIQTEIAKDSDYATIALFLDSKDCVAEFEKTGLRNAVTLMHKTQEAGASSYSLTYQIEDPADKLAELESLTIGGEAVDLRYVDSKTNTYTKYLPNTTFNLPEVTYTVSEGATAEVTDEENKTIITVTSKDGSVIKTYYVDFVISESMSDSASLAFTGNIRENSINGGYNKSSNFVNNGLNGASIVIFESLKHNDYGSCASFFQMDLSALANPDLSQKFEIAFSNVALSWDTTKMASIDLSVYDVTDSFNWATDGVVTSTSGHDMEPNLSNPIDTVNIPTRYIDANGEDKPFTGAIDKLDITEFIRECLRNNILYPTLAFDIEFVEPLKAGESFYRVNFNGAINSSQTNLVYSKLNGQVFDKEAYGTPVISSVEIDGEAINLEYINPENKTYTRYLPHSELFIPEVTASGNEYTEILVTQASSLDGTAEIKATAISGKTETYYVDFVVAESLSDATSISLKLDENDFVINNINGNQNISNSNLNLASTGTITAFEAIKDTTRYLSAVGFFQLDLNELNNVDLSGNFNLKLNNVKTSWDTAKESEMIVNFYDVSNRFDWSTDGTTTSASGKEYEDTMTKLIATKKVSTADTSFDAFDFSEFVRYCVATGNYTPTIAMDIEFVSTPSVQTRLLLTVSITGAAHSVLEYNKLNGEVIDKSVFEIPVISSIEVDGEIINLDFINPANKTYTKYLPYGTEFVPEVTATGNEYTEVSVTQASSVDGTAKINATSLSGKTETYYVDFVVAASESTEKRSFIKDSGFVADYISGTREVGANNQKLNLVFQLFESHLDSRYADTATVIKLDLTKLSKVDLSKDITLEFNNCAFGWDTSKEDNMYISLYDLSDSFDWETQGTTSTYSCQTIEPELTDPLTTVKVATSSNAFNLDISEFVRKCISEGNYTPTLALDMEFEDAPTAMLRINFEIRYTSSANAYFVYSTLN